jgi:hypothetical protein
MKCQFLVLALLFSASLPAQAPVAVPLTEEPHHHLVLENDYVRVFRVSVPAHAATLLHQHDVPYLYVSLGPADVVNAVQGRPEARIVMADGQVGYSPGHFAHIARTDAGSTFDNVTIELLKPQGEPRNLCTQVVPGDVPTRCETKFSCNGRCSYSAEPQFETGAINVDLVRLDPKTAKIAIAPQTGILLVGLNGAEVVVEQEGNPGKMLRGGEVMWLEASAQRALSNASKDASSYLQIAFKNGKTVSMH